LTGFVIYRYRGNCDECLNLVRAWQSNGVSRSTTQAELASRVGCAAVYAAKINRANRPSPDCRLLAKVFDIAPDKQWRRDFAQMIDRHLVLHRFISLQLARANLP
jgi:hypothetical protein